MLLGVLGPSSSRWGQCRGILWREICTDRGTERGTTEGRRDETVCSAHCSSSPLVYMQPCSLSRRQTSGWSWHRSCNIGSLVISRRMTLSVKCKFPWHQILPFPNTFDIFSPAICIWDTKVHFFSWELENWFSTDYSATVCRILIIFSVDPHEISIPMKCWKISPLARLRARACNFCIACIANFGLLASFFFGHFFPYGFINLKLWGIDQQC